MTNRLHTLPHDLLIHIGYFLVDPVLRLDDWVDPQRLLGSSLCKNTAALTYLKQYVEKIKTYVHACKALKINPNPDSAEIVLDWMTICENPAFLPLIEIYPDEICWYSLSKNPAAIHMVEANPDRIDWDGLSSNPAAIHLLEANPDKIDWTILSVNPSAADLLIRNEDKINWLDLCYNPAIETIITWSSFRLFDTDFEALSSNPAALFLLELYPAFIDWSNLSTNPAAIHLLEANADKIDWKRLSSNPAAIHLLEANPDKIDWHGVSFNPNGHLLTDYRKKVSYFGLSPDLFVVVAAETRTRVLSWVEEHVVSYAQHM